MSGEPAIRKVLARLYTWLDGQIGSGVSLFLDRPHDKPYHADNFPYVNMRCDRTAFSVFDYGRMLHEAAIKFDIVSGESSTANIDEVQAEIAAALTARMGAMTMTAGQIGELIQERLPQSMGPEQDTFELSDAGESTFAWALTYLTPLDDFRTIIGQNGLVS